MPAFDSIDLHCPCGSGLAYSQCCELLHKGKPAKTAESLMRSRYSAFALHLKDYLLTSWHPDTRPQQLELEQSTIWKQLEIISSSNDEKNGEVHFKATYLELGEWQLLEETSQFRFQNNHWLYHSGNYQPQTLQPKRNDPCPCGSGKKFKKCCL